MNSQEAGKAIEDIQREMAMKWANNKKTKEALLELYLMNLHIIGTLTAMLEHFGLTEGIPTGKVPDGNAIGAQAGQAG